MIYSQPGVYRKLYFVSVCFNVIQQMANTLYIICGECISLSTTKNNSYNNVREKTCLTSLHTNSEKIKMSKYKCKYIPSRFTREEERYSRS